jgi:hypothetical protein
VKTPKTPRSENDFYARVFIKLFPPGRPDEAEIRRGIVRVPIQVASVLTEPSRPISDHPKIASLQFITLYDACVSPDNPLNAQSESLTWIRIPYPRALGDSDYESSEGVEVWLLSDDERSTEWMKWERGLIEWLKSQGH